MTYQYGKPFRQFKRCPFYSTPSNFMCAAHVWSLYLCFKSVTSIFHSCLIKLSNWGFSTLPVCVDRSLIVFLDKIHFIGRFYLYFSETHILLLCSVQNWLQYNLLTVSYSYVHLFLLPFKQKFPLHCFLFCWMCPALRKKDSSIL